MRMVEAEWANCAGCWRNGYNVSSMAPNKGYASLVKSAITSTATPVAGKHGSTY